MINETTAYDKILLITVLHSNIYRSFKISVKFCSLFIFCEKHHVNTNVNVASLRNSRWHQFSNSVVSGSQWIHRSTAHGERYGIVAFYDHGIFTFCRVSWPRSKPTPLATLLVTAFKLSYLRNYAINFLGAMLLVYS